MCFVQNMCSKSQMCGSLNNNYNAGNLHHFTQKNATHQCKFLISINKQGLFVLKFICGLYLLQRKYISMFKIKVVLFMHLSAVKNGFFFAISYFRIQTVIFPINLMSKQLKNGTKLSLVEINNLFQYEYRTCENTTQIKPDVLGQIYLFTVTLNNYYNRLLFIFSYMAK